MAHLYPSIERDFLAQNFDAKLKVLHDSLHLVRRRARVRTRGVWAEVEPYFGRLALALWAAGVAKLSFWRDQVDQYANARFSISSLNERLSDGVPRSHDEWDVDLLGTNGRFRLAFLFDVLCAWWNASPTAAWQTTRERAVDDVGNLARKMYWARDPIDYSGNTDPRNDDILSQVVQALVGAAVNLRTKSATEIGIHSARLAKALAHVRENPSARAVNWNLSLVPIDWVPRDKNENERTEAFIRRIQEKQGGKPLFSSEFASIFDPYVEGRKWRRVSIRSGGKGEWSPEPAKAVKGKLVVISEVFHEIPVFQLHPFLQAVNALTKGGGVCLVQDLFYLPAGIENDFCLYRCDEIAALFRAIGWRTLDVPRWSKNRGIPYSLVLAIKPKSGLARDTVSDVRAVTERIRYRLISRVNWLYEQWRWRRLQASEIREHFYSVYSLANLVRWQATRAAGDGGSGPAN
ncbi:MAG: hypothetical protein HYX43_05045 [Burkholderiales bacterium]|nr:hypothetical protein [Burkholderiales bacterium]